jgi:hypothetical protein
MGEVDAAALEEAALLDQAGEAAAALGAVPAVGEKGLAALEFTDDAILQSGEIVPDWRDVHRASQDSGSFIARTFSLWRERKSSSFFASARP